MPPQTNKYLQTYPPQKSRKITGRFVAGTLLAGCLTALLVFNYHQNIYDWLRLRNYQPPNDVAALVSADGLTAKASHDFYVNHPLIDSKSDFAQICPNGSKETAVLGCYIPNQRGIYVLSVTDSRLDGIEQVTAAHEMLHAAYDRLNASTKKQVDSWLNDYYNNGLTDQTIKSQLDSYKKTEPNDLTNEMHSIFGTEVSSLPSNLQDYYSQYFADRSKVVGYYNSYEAEFTSRQQQAQSLLTQIKTLEADIKQLESQLNAQRQALASSQPDLHSLQSVNAYNAKVDAYNASVQSYRQLVAQHNSLVDQYNEIRLEVNSLVQDITAQPSQINQQ